MTNLNDLSNPLVSVVLPVNNDDGFLIEAINSIVNQSYQNFELLVIANNCTDELWNHIQSLTEIDPRIKPYRLTLGGLCFALNFGLNAASGKYVARMDADDISHPDRLASQVAYLEEYSYISVLGTQINYIDELGNKKLVQASNLPSDHSNLRKVSYFKCPLYHPTVMFRKNDIQKLGGYKFGFYGEDYELWLRCIHEGYSISNLNETLLDYRVHSSQLSSKSTTKNIYISQMLWIFLKKTHDIKYLSGVLVQAKLLQYLIIKTSKLRYFFKK